LLSKPDAAKHGTNVRLCGLVTDIRTRLDKRENTIAFVRLEQYSGTCECVFWSDKYKQFADLLKPDAVLVICGKMELSGQNVKIFADEVLTIEQAQKKLVKGYVIRIDAEKLTDDSLQNLRDYCRNSTGTDSLLFIVDRPDGQVQYDTLVKLETSPNTTDYLTRMFGDANVQYFVN
jgi:DNA polymerase-3 subunit alpha